jgi:hypothetical protein
MFIFQLGKVPFPVHRRDARVKLAPDAGFRFGRAVSGEFQFVGGCAGGLSWPDQGGIV